MRLPYEPAKSLFIITSSFIISNIFPRFVGWIKTKPSWTKFIHYFNIIIISIFGLTVIYILFALIYNAKKRI
jgi:hypothetical protein